MSLLEASNSTTIGSEIHNTAEAQDKGFKIACMDMLEVLKEEISESLKENH